jgi:hypothetical protein
LIHFYKSVSDDTMLCKTIFSVGALIITTLAAPSPQEGDPNDDVEVLLNGPVSTNDPDYDYGGDYGGFFGSGFPSLFGAPRVRVVVVPVDEVGLDGGVGGLGDILSSIFGPTRDLAPPSEEGVDTGAADCGVMCTFIKELLEGHLKDVREHIDDVRDRENEIGGDYDLGSDSDEGFDVNNSTHTTKVLEDGSVVHINKTTISDTDDDGNSFFFHKSVIHTVNDGETSNGKEGAVNEEEEEEVLTDIPEYVDEALSGTPEYVDGDGDDLEEEEKSGGVDDGLMQ